MGIGRTKLIVMAGVMAFVSNAYAAKEKDAKDSTSGTRVALIRMQEAIKDTKDGKSAEATLKKEIEDRQKKLQAEGQKIQGAMEELMILAFCMTVPIAFREILTDQHLPTSYGPLATGGLDSFSIVYASATFGNRNTYAAFLVLVFPFLLWQFEGTILWIGYLWDRLLW